MLIHLPISPHPPLHTHVNAHSAPCDLVSNFSVVTSVCYKETLQETELTDHGQSLQCQTSSSIVKAQTRESKGTTAEVKLFGSYLYQ